MELQRKIYKQLLEWKEQWKGTSSLMIEGAKGVGKTTVAEKLGREQYKSYVVIDFGKANKRIKDTFNEDLLNFDIFFQNLMLETNVRFYNRDTLLIFKDIQYFPRARETLKFLVEDGRYDYIATGSLISIYENVKDIIIPSEVHHIKMYPLDLEEFFLAANEGIFLKYIKHCFDNKQPLDPYFHKKAMRLFSEYILVGGMPSSVVAYFDNNRSLYASESAKREILNSYKEEINTTYKRYRNKVSRIFNQIPSYLSKKDKRVTLSCFGANQTFRRYEDSLFWLTDSMICNLCYKCIDPLKETIFYDDHSKMKCYMGDTGLLISHTFTEDELNPIYKDIINGKYAIHNGMFFENAIAQLLVSKRIKLHYYNEYSETQKRNDIEINFLFSNTNPLLEKYIVTPIEVKASKNFTTSSYTKFKAKYKKHVGESYIISPKPFSKTENGYNIPPYMVIFLFND